MAKPLSEHLAELSVRAKHAEDALAAAQKEAHDKVVARKEQARVAAAAAIEKVNNDIKSAQDTATRNWSAVRAKVAADINSLKADVAHKKHDLDAKRAQNYADGLHGRQMSQSTTPLPPLTRQGGLCLTLSLVAPRPS